MGGAHAGVGAGSTAVQPDASTAGQPGMRIATKRE